MAERKQTDELLRERILSALQQDIGISAAMAKPFVESVMGCFAGERPYFPAKSRAYPVSQIRAALESGIPVKQVMRTFDVSRSKLHDLFPGGLPRRSSRAASTELSKMETI